MHRPTQILMKLQKVSMLLHLPGIKTALFTRQIIITNQDIVPLDYFKSTNVAQNNNRKLRGCLWHETIQGQRVKMLRV